MLSLLKKKSEADTPQAPAWHPNFRNFQRLPDTKVVRTAFFINGVAVTVALVLLIFVGRREWDLHVLNAQIADLQSKIDHDKTASDDAITLFKKYQVEEAKLLEIDTFVKSKPVVSELLIHLGQTLPKNIALDKFDLREAGLALSATVRGAPDQASGLASAYVDQLRADKDLARFDDVAQTNSGRNTQTGRITIDILLHLKTAGKDGKK